MARKLVIIGGVAGGATAAARARRLDENAEIVVVERGPDIAFANCGLPYYIGGEIDQRDKLLVQTADGMRARFNLDIRLRTTALAIDRKAKTVRLRNDITGDEVDEHYDKLLVSPGAAPIRPPLPGIDHPRIFALRNLADTDAIKQAVDDNAHHAVVVGGGFIGLEMAENLHRRGVHVTLVELTPQVMPPLDPEFAEQLHITMRENNIDLRLGVSAQSFADSDGKVCVELSDSDPLTADFVVLAIGVKPDTAWLAAAGLQTADRGALVVDSHMRTNDPDIYAVGDAVLVEDAVLGGSTFLPLAGPANRQARIAVNHAFGRDARFRGVLGTSIVRVFDRVAALTGASEKQLKKRGVRYQKIYVHPKSHAGYFPGAAGLTIKLLFTPDTGKLLGAQLVGGDGVDKRTDVLALALQADMTVFDLEDVELAYAPQFSGAKDPINYAGFVAANVLREDMPLAFAEDLLDQPAGVTILDVRQPAEFEAGAIPGALLVPLPELRARLAEIPKDKPVIAYCAAGQRGYYATRTLMQHGYNVRNLTGGFTTYRTVKAAFARKRE